MRATGHKPGASNIRVRLQTYLRCSRRFQVTLLKSCAYALLQLNNKDSDVVTPRMPKPSTTTRKGCITFITSEPILALGQNQTWPLICLRKRSGWIRITPWHTFNLDTPIPG